VDQQKWFRKVMLEYEGRLIRYTKKIIKDEQVAQEIVQNCFLKLWKGGKKSLECKIPPWLYLVCRNEAFDQFKKNKRQQSSEVTGEEYFLIECDKEQQVMKSQIFKYIQYLSSKHQEVLVLKFQEGMSYKEISEVMKISSSHVGLLIHEGIKQLRIQLNEKMDGDHHE
jgi:RNA polymerase sigma factor (sigma-70 family)